MLVLLVCVFGLIEFLVSGRTDEGKLCRKVLLLCHHHFCLCRHCCRFQPNCCLRHRIWMASHYVFGLLGLRWLNFNQPQQHQANMDEIDGVKSKS